MEWAAAISAVFGVIAILLRDYIPAWRKENEQRGSKEESDSFGQDIVDGDDIGASVRLSELYDRVRGGKDGHPSQ